MKLRSIASVQVTENTRQIMANKYTTILTIPEYFRDWKVFNDPNYVYIHFFFQIANIFIRSQEWKNTQNSLSSITH